MEPDRISGGLRTLSHCPARPIQSLSARHLMPVGAEGDRIDVLIRQLSIDPEKLDWELHAFWSHLQPPDPQQVPAKPGLRTPLNVWNNLVARPYGRALRTVKGERPDSVIPLFLVSDTSKPWTEPRGQRWDLVYHLSDRAPDTPLPAPDESATDAYSVSFVLLQTLDDDKATQPGEVGVEAELCSFLTRDGSPLHRVFGLRKTEPQALVIDWDRPGPPRVLLNLVDISASGQEKPRNSSRGSGHSTSISPMAPP